MYKDFLKRKSSIRAFYDDTRKAYIDFGTISNETIKDIGAGGKFDLNSFLDDNSTQTITLIPNKVTTDSSGDIVTGTQSPSVDLSTLSLNSTAIPFTTIVTFKLNVTDPQDYIVTVKGQNAQLDSSTNNFGVAISGILTINDFTTFDFITNSTTSTNQLMDTSISDSDINNAADINFDSNISASDLKIDSWKMYNNGTDVEFFVTYESGIDRYVSFFNPPNGDIFMKTSGAKLRAGTNSLKFKIPVSEYNSAKDGITMKFWNTDSDNNYTLVLQNKNLNW